MFRPCRAAALLVLAALATACGGTTRRAATPHSKTTLTSATVAPRVQRLVVVDKGGVSMVARNGCLATVRTAENEASTHDELRVRCPRPDRMRAWFEGADRVVATLALDPMSESEEEEEHADRTLPTAKLLTAGGKAFRTTKPEDAEKLAAEVRALSVELEGAEKVAPGPASPAGWQMLHVMGPAHVLLAGAPARGIFEARMSTNGQYMCEFITTVGDGPMRATKSGWLSPAAATRAIDEVLGPFNALAGSEKPASTFAAGTKAGTEQQSNVASTAAVFERFAEVQDVLGDACLPELEAPSAPPVGL